MVLTCPNSSGLQKRVTKNHGIEQWFQKQTRQQETMEKTKTTGAKKESEIQSDVQPSIATTTEGRTDLGSGTHALG